MSRYYKLSIIAVGIPKDTVEKILSEHFGWEGEADCWDGRIYYFGEGSLYGGQTEEQAHCQISAMLKSVYPDAKVRSEWTHMEDLPFEAYGDAIAEA